MTSEERPVSPVNGQPLPIGKPFATGDERASEAGKKSAESRLARKTLREELLSLLESDVVDKKGNTKQAQVAMSAALIKQAISGNTKAFEIIRDTIGEKPTEKVEMKTDMNIMQSAERLRNMFADIKNDRG